MDNIEVRIEKFRKQLLPIYNEALKRHDAYNAYLDKRFYKSKKNVGKEAPERPEFNMETNEIFKSYNVVPRWNNLLREYEEKTGKKYKKSIIYNANRESALESNQQAKEEARSARDILIEKRREERFAREEEARRKEALKPKKVFSRDYIDAKKYYDTITNIDSVLDSLISARVPTKANKKLFNDMKSLVSEIGKEAEEKVKAYKVIRKVPREILDAKLKKKEPYKVIRKVPREVLDAKLKAKKSYKVIRKVPREVLDEKLKAKKSYKVIRKVPREVLDAKLKEKEPIERKGRPIDLNSKRQIKLAIDCKKREEYLKGL